MMNTALNWIRFWSLMLLRALVRLFYRFEVSQLSSDKEPFKQVKLAILLNHTSLFEPIYIGTMPTAFVKKLSFRAIFPGAKETLDRPLAGLIFKLLAPSVISLTRKRDESWDQFLTEIDEGSLILFMPEGRMKRPNGLDKHGQPMTIRGGVVDLLRMLKTGKLLICYSGGLHHVQTPGQGLPKLFKTIRCAYESVDIESYLSTLQQNSPTETELRGAIINDLETRRDRVCATLTH